MIDKDGYRANVGIILANGLGKVFWGRRVNQDAWQFPQGGIGTDESPTQAMYRELNEEIGIRKNDVRIIAKTRQWLHYNLPPQMIRQDSFPRCIGQKQKWFLLLLHSNDSVICLDRHPKPEFDHWQWVSYWYPLNQVIAFKRDVYRKALCELSAKHSQLMGKTLC